MQNSVSNHLLWDVPYIMSWGKLKRTIKEQPRIAYNNEHKKLKIFMFGICNACASGEKFDFLVLYLSINLKII